MTETFVLQDNTVPINFAAVQQSGLAIDACPGACLHDTGRI